MSSPCVLHGWCTFSGSSAHSQATSENEALTCRTSSFYSILRKTNKILVTLGGWVMPQRCWSACESSLTLSAAFSDPPCAAVPARPCPNNRCLLFRQWRCCRCPKHWVPLFALPDKAPVASLPLLRPVFLNPIPAIVPNCGLTLVCGQILSFELSARTRPSCSIC